MGFPRQKYWSGLPFPPPVDLFHSGIKCQSPALAGGFFTTELPGKPTYSLFKFNKSKMCIVQDFIFHLYPKGGKDTDKLPYQDFFCKSDIHMIYS